MPCRTSVAAITGGLFAAALCFKADTVLSRQQDDEMRFEVASIKRTTTSASSQVRILPTQFVATGTAVQRLLINAYGVPATRILNAPSWVTSDRFELNAKTPRASSREEVAAMLRTLLKERFELEARIESRMMDVYALGIAGPDR